MIGQRKDGGAVPGGTAPFIGTGAEGLPER